MRAVACKRNVVCLSLIAVLCGSFYSSVLLADDDSKPGSSPETQPAKPGAPTPLTERERSLLDKVEQLEKRVAELESKSAKPSEMPAVANSTAAATPNVLAATAPGATSGAAITAESPTTSTSTGSGINPAKVE